MNSMHKRRGSSQEPVRKSRLFSAIVALAVLAAAFWTVRWLVFREPPFRADEILAAYQQHGQYAALNISYPFDGTLFPPEIVPPTFRWQDGQSDSDKWLLSIRCQDGLSRLNFPCHRQEWTPSEDEWDTIKRRCVANPAEVIVLGVNRMRPEVILSEASISIAMSEDEVGAPIFYREVILPFIEAVKDPSRIRWRFGDVSCKTRPPVVLEKLPVCGNCHSFSAHGDVLGMDVDYANDTGSYAIVPVSEEMTLRKSRIVTWADYQKDDGEPTFGLLSQVSPNGKYTVSTVKDRSVFVPTPGLAFSQLFFPIQGILGVYTRETGKFHALPGADDKQFVQSNPSWSPDGKYVVFARSKAYRLSSSLDDQKALLSQKECREFLEEGKPFQFDLYRIPFNEGRGGTPEPLEGASHNGMSNYFAKYSPDGKWIVFCKGKNYMLLQPDSELYIIPAEGGEARRLRCNTARMNSWHSWSPNSKWLVFSSKAMSDYTQLFLTHIDEQGRSSPAVLLSQFTGPDRAANIPEFVPPEAGPIRQIREQFVDDNSYRRAGDSLVAYDPQEAVDGYQKALQLDPNNAAVHRALGTVLAMQEMYKQARTHLVQSIQLDPNVVETHSKLAVVLQRQGKFQEAADACREALRLDPQDATAHLTLGLVLPALGNADEALGHLAEAVRLQPDDPTSRYTLAEALHRNGRQEEAAAHFQRILKHNPNFVPALLRLASIRTTSKNPKLLDADAAVKLATRACELTHYEHSAALLNLSMAYCKTGQFPEARAAAERARHFVHRTRDPRIATLIQQHLEFCISQLRTQTHP